MPTKTDTTKKKPAKKPVKEAEIAPETEKEQIKSEIAQEIVRENVESQNDSDEKAVEEFLENESRSKKPERYFEGIGRRKTSVARVRLFTRAGDFMVNGKHYADYFPTLDQQKIAEEALQKMKLFGRFKVLVKVSGGGIHSQAEALRHGLARCLIKFNPDFRKRLKRATFLKRDPRMKERKKFGLNKARKAPQWAKR